MMRDLTSILGRTALVVVALTGTAAAQGSVAGQVSLLERPGERTEDLADVIVWLEPTGGTRVRTLPTNTTIQLQGRQFSPRVRAVTQASKVEFPNADSFSHNVFSKAPDGAFDTGVFPRGRTKEQTFKEPGVFPIYCNIHPRMTGYVIVLGTPYYAQAGEDGRFTLTGVPAGNYLLHIWHDRVGDGAPRALTVSTNGVNLGTIQLDARGYRFVQHKNKFAHDAGVIHRDIKPQNMVVEGDGTLKVMDFGIARLASRTPSQGLTDVGTVIGTPEYMAPEQLLGEEIDVRADIYSAGVVMYECLTSRPPFEASSPMVLIAKVLDETAAAPHALHAEIPIGLSALVMKAMARERDGRPASAMDLHDALEALV
jgi:plastocyanin